jgi:hypothetical protein
MSQRELPLILFYNFYYATACSILLLTTASAAVHGYAARTIASHGGQSPFETEVQKKKRVKAVYFFGGGTEVPLDLFNSGKLFPNGAELRPRSHPTALFFLADVQLDNLFPERALRIAFGKVITLYNFHRIYCTID